MKLSGVVFTVWTTSMLLGVHTFLFLPCKLLSHIFSSGVHTWWHLGTLWPVLAVMAGWVAPLVHIGDGVKWTQIYRRTLSTISEVMDEYG